MEGTAFTAARTAGAYNIYVTGGASPDPAAFLVQRVTSDMFKSGYKHDEMFDLIKKANREVDQQKRHQMYLRVQEIMYEEATPFIWLYQMEQIDAMKKSVVGYRLDLKNWNLREADIVKA
jgi:ABC-type transport system substrate-binding protein